MNLGPLRIVSCTFCQYSSRYDALLSGQVVTVLETAREDAQLGF